MPASSRAAVQRLAALGIAAAITVGPAPASAALLDEPPRRTSFNLDEAAAPGLPLLRAFRNAAVERPGPLRVYLSSAYGRWQQRPWWELSWRDPRSAPDDSAQGERRLDAPRGLRGGDPFFSAFDMPGSLRFEPALSTWLQRLDPSWSPPLLASTGPSFSSNGFDLLWGSPRKQVPDWRCRRRPVQFFRFGGRHDTFPLVRCDGSVAPGALDRLSIMARPPEAPDPGELLPDEPDTDAWQRALEWVPQVRLLHPRLLWLIQQVADAFPRRAIHIYSGYRPPRRSAGARPAPKAGAGTHHSQHAEGRAMDIAVIGIPNTTLFQFCRTLDDVGCGFYPNNKFVHVDVRRPGTRRAFWIDVSRPGEPSEYVDAWPGVVEHGAMSGAAGSGE